jgi:hypothetical protein
VFAEEVVAEDVVAEEVVAINRSFRPCIEKKRERQRICGV